MLTSLESTVKELAKIQKISKKCSVYDIHCSSLLEDASRNVQYVHFFFSFFFVKLKTLLFFRCIKLVLSLAHLLVFLSAERRSPKSNESQTIDSRGPVKLMRAFKRGQNPAYGNLF